MKAEPIKTPPIVAGDSLAQILDQAVNNLSEESVVAISSKIVALTENSVVKIGEKEKKELIYEQAEYYLPENNPYDFTLTIKYNILIASAGIDESNGNGFYVLWPKNPQASADSIRLYLKKRFNLKKIGVLIVDSKTTPLKRGVTGVAVAHSGFSAINNYVGKKDIFGRPFKVEQSNIAESLAAACVVVMGEGDEQTPLAVVTDAPFVDFKDRVPSQEELDYLHFPIDEDLYSELIKSVPWKKGQG